MKFKRSCFLRSTHLRSVLFLLSLGVSFISTTNSTVWAASPVLVSIAPAQGQSSPDQNVTITAAYSDADGRTNLTDLRLLVNTSTSMANAVCLRYVRATNKLYLLDNAGASWLGGFAPGSSNTLENSLGRLYCAQTTVTGSGTTLTVTGRVSFKTSFAGKTYNTYLWAKDNATAVGWTKFGTWIVDNTPPTTPVVTDDGSYTASKTQLHAQWSSSDPETGVAEYQYQITRASAIGTVIVPWTSTGTTTSVTKTGLSLAQGVQYFFSVKARNGVNLWSAGGASDGIFVDSNAPLIGTITPADGTTYVDGASVQVTVAASDPDGDALQCQFLVDGMVKQPWGSAVSWMWNTTGIVREHTITIQVRDPYTRQVEQGFRVFGYRKSKGNP